MDQDQQTSPSKELEEMIHPEGKLLEKIDRSTLTPLNDPGCNHQWHILDEDSGVPNHTAVACKSCPLGHLVSDESLPALNLPVVSGSAQSKS